MINKINSNISFSRGRCSITPAKLSQILNGKENHKLIKIGGQCVPAYSSNYKKQYFDELAKKAEMDVNIQRAKFWQEIEDRKKIEKSYLDLKI